MPIRHPSWHDICKTQRTPLADCCLAAAAECSESDINCTGTDTASDLHQVPLENGLLPLQYPPPRQSPPPPVLLCSELGTSQHGGGTVGPEEGLGGWEQSGFVERNWQMDETNNLLQKVARALLGFDGKWAVA
jgi:hypothetical protein